MCECKDPLIDRYSLPDNYIERTSNFATTFPELFEIIFHKSRDEVRATNYPSQGSFLVCCFPVKVIENGEAAEPVFQTICRRNGDITILLWPVSWFNLTPGQRFFLETRFLENDDYVIERVFMN